MKQAVVTIKYEEEKLNAIKQYMGKKDADFESELNEVLGKMYEKYVPQAVREYIDSRGDVPAAIKKSNKNTARGTGVCFTYMEQSRGRDTLTAVCGIVFLAFLLLAVMDSLPTKRKRGANGWGIQELLLLDEEGNEISAWHIGGKTSLLIGRDEHKENVDINLQNTEYGGMVDRQHAVLNYAAGQWYIEDLGSRNGVRIQDAKDGKLYQVSKEHPCRINAGDIIFIGNTRLRAK